MVHQRWLSEGPYTLSCVPSSRFSIELTCPYHQQCKMCECKIGWPKMFANGPMHTDVRSEFWVMEILSSVPNGTLMHFYDLWGRHFLMRLYLKKLKLCVNHIHVGIFYEPPINPVMNWNSLLCIGSSVLINVSVTFFWWLNVEYLM